MLTQNQKKCNLIVTNVENRKKKYTEDEKMRAQIKENNSINSSQKTVEAVKRERFVKSKKRTAN